jgi:hypothetical protein
MVMANSRDPGRGVSQAAMSDPVSTRPLVPDAAGRRFTMVYAKTSAPKEIWDKPGFIALNKNLTMAWFPGFLAMTAFSVVGGLFPPESTVVLGFNWAIPGFLIITDRLGDGPSRVADLLTLPGC